MIENPKYDLKLTLENKVESCEVELHLLNSNISLKKPESKQLAYSYIYKK